MFEDFASAVNGFFGIVLDGIKVFGFGVIVVATVLVIGVAGYYFITRILAPLARIVYDHFHKEKPFDPKQPEMTPFTQ